MGNQPAVTQEYADGRAVDLYGDPSHPMVLIWHGMQTDSRSALQPLAERIARRQLYVVVPDWNSHANDGGRADLLHSSRFAAERASDPFVLVGWSMGGLAAAGLTLRADEFGVPVVHTVCLAGAFIARDPISGNHLARDIPDGGSVPLTLLHGTADDVVAPAVSHEFRAALTEAGWAADVVELDTDHGAIAGARYDAAADRYEPASDDATLAMADDVAARIAECVSR